MTKQPTKPSELKAWFAEDKARWNALTPESQETLARYSPYPNDVARPVEKTPKPLGRPRTWPEKHARIVAALQNGMPLSDVVRDFMVPEHRIRAIGRQIGIEFPRRRRVFPTAERNAEIVKAHDAGETQTAIARRLGISRNRVGEIVRKRKTPW